MRWSRVALRRRDAAVDPIDRGRRLHDKAVYSVCYAPSTSMYFDQRGIVRACCQNTGVALGDVRTQTIREIWEGASGARMRDALTRRDFSQGCGFCGWQHAQGDAAVMFSRGFDHHPVAEAAPRWPVQMEFAMSNACNLQCRMCNGDWSSAIRAQREHRPPLPAVYGDEFFAQLEEFLPHLRKVNILGGEPFLGSEPLRLMEMLIDTGSRAEVVVTTNGTQWNRRVQSICERLPLTVVVSLDGITPETYEHIRVGADFEQVMANLDRFGDYATKHGTSVSITHCLMRSNWREFADLLVCAEGRGWAVGINTVVYPRSMSLLQLSRPELAEVVAGFERMERTTVRGLSRLRPVWDGQFQALRNRLAVLESGTARSVAPWSVTPDPVADPLSADGFGEHVVDMDEWSGQPLCRLDLAGGRVTSSGILVIGDSVLDPVEVVGATISEVIERIEAALGEGCTRETGPTGMVDDVVLTTPSSVGGGTGVRILFGTGGATPGASADVAWVGVRTVGVAGVGYHERLLSGWSGVRKLAWVDINRAGVIEAAGGSLDPFVGEGVEAWIGRRSDDLRATALAWLGGELVRSSGAAGLLRVTNLAAAHAGVFVTIGIDEWAQVTRVVFVASGEPFDHPGGDHRTAGGSE